MMENTMTDIFNIQSPINQTNNDSVVSIDQMMTSNNQQVQNTPLVEQTQSTIEQSAPVIEQTEPIIEKPEKKKNKVDKILIVQLSLLFAWGILTALIYFFGYDLFEPFIKV